MTRVRLREARPEGEAAYYSRTYPQGYRHDRWPDHVERVAASVELISRYKNQIHTAADLSCGDAAIMRGLAPGLREAYLGDLNGVLIEDQEAVALAGCDTVASIGGRSLPGSLHSLPPGKPSVDLLILSETIEHMDDPDDLLRTASLFSRYLFLSTPVAETAAYGNAEHYWGWDVADVQQMLEDTGWHPLELVRLQPQSTRSLSFAYTFQLWMASR